MFKLFFHSPGTPTTQSCRAFEKSEPFGLAHSELGSLPFIPSEVRLRSSLMTWGVDQNQSLGLFGGGMI